MPASELELVPTKLPPGAIIISISQADAWLTCQRKWMFSYLFEKQSDHVSRALAMGIIGHEILAIYYQALKNGSAPAEAYQKAMLRLTEYFTDGETDSEVLSMVHGLVSRYIDQDSMAGLEILEVEEDFFIPINDQFWYGMRIDLLIKDSRGRVRLIDHKFTYDFYQPDELRQNSQMPKYMAGLRFAGYPVVEAYLNQFRTRFKSHLISKKTDEELFKRDPVGITEERVKSNLKYQLIASERIVKRRALPLKLAVEESLPVQNKMVCKNCSFRDPCMKMNEGYTVEKALGTGYVPKTSGFDIKPAELVD